MSRRSSKISRKNHRGYKYKVWRQAVLLKGDYQCSQCGSKEELTADHILPRSKYPELELDVDNGRVLCDKCRVADMLKSLLDGRIILKRWHPRKEKM